MTVFLAIDTNGLPGTVQGFDPVVIAMAVAVVNGDVLRWDGMLVRQPRHMIEHPYTYGALLANGLTADAVCNAPLEPEPAAAMLRGLLGGQPVWTWHRPFVEKALSIPPWSFRPNEYGDGIMAWAAMAISGGKTTYELIEGRTVAKVVPKRRLVSLDDACVWGVEQGWDVKGPTGLPTWTPESGVLHCLDRVVRTAKLAMALQRTGLTHRAYEAAKGGGLWG